MFGRVLAVLMLGLLAGCGNPPMHYFMLASAPGNAPAASVKGPPIQVRSVGLPALLDRQSLVVATSRTGVAISGQDRWAAPLDGMIQTVLAADLRTRLPGKVLTPGVPAAPGPTRKLDVTIERFLPDTTGLVMLVADWALLDSRHGRREAGGHETIAVQAASGGPNDTTAAMSRALGELANRIAAEVTRTSS